MYCREYHISYLKILETDRCLKLSSALTIFSQRSHSSLSIQLFIKSLSYSDINPNDDDDHDDDDVNLDSFLKI